MSLLEARNHSSSYASFLEFAINWQVRALIGIVRGKLLVDVNAESGATSRMHRAIFEVIEEKS